MTASQASAIAATPPVPPPPSTGTLLGSARHLSETGDIEGALAAWAHLRQAAPEMPEAWYRASSLLIRAGRLDEAETLLLEGQAAFPAQTVFFIDHGWVAHYRRDWPLAEQRWAEVRRRFPQNPAGYLYGSWDLRDSGRLEDAAALLAIAEELFPDDQSVLSERALAESRLRRADAMVAAWARVREKFPASGAGYGGGAEAFRDLGRLEEAEALIAQGRELFPQDRGIGFTWADMAMRRSAWVEAAERWLALLQTFPDDLHCLVQAHRSLALAADHDRADVIIARARALAPNDFNVAFQWGLGAEQRADWPAAISRWSELRAAFPQEPRPCIHLMRALAASGDKDAARALATTAVAAFPHDAEVVATAGDIAARYGDIDTAIACFAAAYRANRENFAFATRYVDALLRVDRREDAAAVLREAAVIWPREERFVRWQVEIALRDRDFDAALAAWRQVRESWGDSHDLTSALALQVLDALPPENALRPVLAFLSLASDSGERMWLPAFADLGSFFFMKGQSLRQSVSDFVCSDSQAMDPTTRLLWKALLGIPFTEPELQEAFERHLASGRLGIVSVLFGSFAFSYDRRSQSNAIAGFDRFVARKLAEPAWIREDNALELLSYLIFAAILSPAAHRLLVTHAAQRLHFNAIPLGAPGETPAAALAGLLRGAGPAFAVPAVVSRTSRPLNVALCVSGQLRGYEQALPTWRHLGLQDHKVSTFVHTWKDAGGNWTRAWAFLRPYPTLYDAVVAVNGVDFLRNRFPALGAAAAAAIEARKNIAPATLQAFYGTDHVAVEDDKTGILADKPNGWKMHYKIEQAHALAAAAMPADTLFVRIRPDLGLADAGSIDWERVHFESQRDRLLFADMDCSFIGKSGHLKMADAFLAGVGEPMAGYASVYSSQKDLMARGAALFDAPAALAGHVSVAFHCTYRGITARVLPGLPRSNFVEATILPPAIVLGLLRQDIGSSLRDQLDRDFLEACETAAA